MNLTKQISGPSDWPLARFKKLMLAGVVLLVVTACGKPVAEPPIETDAPAARLDDGYAHAIRKVLSRDTELGTVRNHAPETDTLANSVRAYVARLEEIDFSSCPPEFVDAFGRHRNAWQASLEFFEEFDSLRGELHVLFDEIRGRDEQTRKTLVDIEKEIWGTWKDVETAAGKHGVSLTEQAH